MTRPSRSPSCRATSFPRARTFRQKRVAGRLAEGIPPRPIRRWRPGKPQICGRLIQNGVAHGARRLFIWGTHLHLAGSRTDAPAARRVQAPSTPAGRFPSRQAVLF